MAGATGERGIKKMKRPLAYIFKKTQGQVKTGA
jgi:hypothetical protein